MKAGVHEGEVLIGEGDVDEELRFDAVDEGGCFGDVVGVDLVGGDVNACACFDVLRDGVAFALGARGEVDVVEDAGKLGAFVGNDVAYATCSDD